MTTRETYLRAMVVGSLDSPYLAQTLAALATQTHRPDEIVLATVDRNHEPSTETWDRLLADACLDPDRVRHVPAAGAPTFGAAVRRALRTIDDGAASSGAGGTDRSWLWLLHDDSAPEPRALEHLLTAVDVSNSIAVAGTKQVEWEDPDRLISVGARATRWGRRFTGIEDGEIDQGQHDGTDDVLAVGTAGMLIDLRLWRQLGGPDPVLGPFEDGRDLSQRARLAGHRVVVVPRAVVRHARAGYRGWREEPDTPSDTRRSFRARREAVLHLRLASARALAVPLLAVLAVLAGPARALWRVSANELGLAVAEVIAPLVVLSHPRAIARARRRARRTRRLPQRRLRSLQAPWSEVARLRRDRRMQAAAARRAARTPSELEIAERAAVARRRRITLAAVCLVAVALSLVTVAPTAFSGALTGGALLPSDDTFAELWRAATSSWIASGDGYAGPPDPFLLVLTGISGLTGGPLGVPVQLTVAILLVLAIPLAALTAWFAAGAVTRSVLLRAWAALAWALGPTLLIGLGAGRLGGVVAHIVLPLAVLAVVRSLGLDRRDVFVSGMVGAQRMPQRTSSCAGKSAREAKRARLAALARVARPGSDQPDKNAAEPESAESTRDEADAAAAAPADRTDAGGTAPEPASEETDGTPADEATDDEHAGEATDGEHAGEATDGEHAGEATDGEHAGEATDGEHAGEATDDEAPTQATDRPTPRATSSGLDWTGVSPIPSNTGTPYESAADEQPRAAVVSRVSRAGSLGAAAAAGLALTVVVSGAPVLLGAGLLATVVLALALGRRRNLPVGRGRLVLVLLPAVVALVPLLLHAAGTENGWRVLFADPGAPVPSDPGPAWLAMLGWPQQPLDLAILPAGIAGWVPLAGTAVILLGAVAALFRGGGRARGVRIGWLVALAGLATALVSTRVAVGIGRGSDGLDQVVHGWAGPGTSLVLAGLLIAMLGAADGLRGTLSDANFGWRQVTAAVSTVVVLLTLTASAVGFTAQVLADRSGTSESELMLIGSRGISPVPALGLELQSSEQQSRVLMVTATSAGVDAQLWRDNGPQLTETAATVQVQRWAERTTGTTDPADASLTELVAALVSGTAEDAAGALAEHAIAVVIVPPEETTVTGPAAVDTSGRSAIIAELDAVPGLERVTENSAGVIWRLSLGEGSSDSAIARLQLRDGDGTLIQNVPATDAHLGGPITAEGSDRTVTLADRADPAWRAWLGGTPLRAGEDPWRQTFLVPDGATGDLVLHHRPLWFGPWRVVAVVVGVLTVLLALPTRRRRGETG
ncbi:glycosyltransferase [Ruania zhangjianzhongii]|uniref:glycosyltransferase n=1 Tax=Ruania zhangjianzhongii TaxID=2603206 RepID=UPI0011CB7181|nr:glycosyltransferase [Ruania zhangjianzhongii]